MTRKETGAASGGCLCGAVRYRAAGKPSWTAYCHCHSCRRATASPVAAFAGFDEARFSYMAGSPQVFESSPGVWRSFCGRCGSPLTYRARKHPGEVHVLIGTLDDPQGFAPHAHVFCEERIAWFDTTDEARRFPKLPPRTS